MYILPPLDDAEVLMQSKNIDNSTRSFVMELETYIADPDPDGYSSPLKYELLIYAFPAESAEGV